MLISNKGQVGSLNSYIPFASHNSRTVGATSVVAVFGLPIELPVFTSCNWEWHLCITLVYIPSKNGPCLGWFK